MYLGQPITEPWLDSLGQSHRFIEAPQRVVSLVPSETQSVLDLGASARLVGVTDYCPQGHNALTLGGTKNPNVDAVLACKPDLVLCNQEENTERVVRRLIDMGLRVHVSFPRTLSEGIEYATRLARLLGVAGLPANPPASIALHPRRRVFVPIWRSPWMTFNAQTYADSVLHAAGFDNVFANRTRRKTLAQDLCIDPNDAEPADGDTRYPRLSIEEIALAKPDVILLPDEPYVFGTAEADELHERTGARVMLLSGKPLFWYGTRSATAVSDLLSATSELR